MQGQHGNTTIIEIVQEDFVETPGGDAVVEVLDDTEGVSEAGAHQECPLCQRNQRPVEAAESVLGSRRQGVLEKS